MQRRLCEMSEAKWSITEAKCLQMSHNKYASQRDAISYSMGYLMLSHSAGMQQPDISIAGFARTSSSELKVRKDSISLRSITSFLHTCLHTSNS